MTPEQIKDAAQFSNFAQAVKMKYWEKCGVAEIPATILEARLDEILLLAWDESSASQSQRFREILESLQNRTEYNTYNFGEMGEFINIRHLRNFINEAKEKL